MKADCGRMSTATLAMLLAVVVSLNGGGWLACEVSAQPYSLVNTSNWVTYTDPNCSMKIGYPSDLSVAASTYEVAVSGAVVTFVPGYDPSIDDSGAKTNLFGFSVTVGAMEITPTCTPDDTDCLPVEQASHGQAAPGEIRFAKSYHAEGAAGSRYETYAHTAICDNVRYEITLVIHSGNPDCYLPGKVKAFDPEGILRLFEAMVATFRPLQDNC